MSAPFSSDSEGFSVRSALAQWVFSPLAGVTARDWVRLLRRRGSSIPPRYWARTAFTTAMSLLNSAVARREQRFEEAVATAEVNAPLFILGHHRSGTTHLRKLLAVDERFSSPTMTEVLFPDTFLTFEPLAQALAQQFAPQERPQDEVQISGDTPFGEEWALCAGTYLSSHMMRHFPQDRDDFKRYLTMRGASTDERTRWKRAFDRFARKLLVRHGGESTLLFKSPQHTAKIPLLLDLYPDARFVHIYRNPIRVFKSTMKMERKALPFCTYQRPPSGTLEDLVLWRYRALYDAFFEDVDQIPDDQFAEVRFESLTRDRVGTVERVYDELGLSDFESVRPRLEQYVNSVADYSKNTYPDLPASTRHRIREAWTPCFHRWGYELEEIGAERPSEPSPDSHWETVDVP